MQQVSERVFILGKKLYILSVDSKQFLLLMEAGGNVCVFVVNDALRAGFTKLKWATRRSVSTFQCL